MNHVQIINYLINTYNFKTYLEVGVYNGINYNQIKCDNKECCDPCVCTNIIIKCDITYKTTSDEMFEQMPANKKYDIIFIDGMHDEAFVDRDIMNSLKHLNKNGVICLHDTFPPTKLAVKKYDTYANNRGTWCGDVFKSILKLNQTDLEYYTVKNNDFGLTVIKYYDNFNVDLQKLITDYEYEDIFSSTNVTTDLGNKLLHEISVDEFKKIFI